MTPEQFCYWLQGFAEVADTCPSAFQWKEIQGHLNTVFKKVTPTPDKENIFDGFYPHQAAHGNIPYCADQRLC